MPPSIVNPFSKMEEGRLNYLDADAGFNHRRHHQGRLGKSFFPWSKEYNFFLSERFKVATQF